MSLDLSKAVTIVSYVVQFLFILLELVIVSSLWEYLEQVAFKK
jgi:hypothetical protein